MLYFREMKTRDIAMKINANLNLEDIGYAEKIVREVFEVVKEGVCSGKKVTLYKIGNMYVDVKKERKWFNPRTRSHEIKKATWCPKISFHDSFVKRIKSKPLYEEKN